MLVAQQAHYVAALEPTRQIVVAHVGAGAARRGDRRTARPRRIADLRSAAAGSAQASPRQCLGALVQAIYPVSVITDGMGLNITVMSYRGHLDFGIVADREEIPDVWKPIGWLRESLDELRPAAAREQPRAAISDAGATEQPEQPRATRPSRTQGARQRRARER